MSLYNRKKSLSYSQYATFAECPQKWHLMYVQGLRPAIPAKALKIGSAVHKAIENYISMGVTTTPIQTEESIMASRGLETVKRFLKHYKLDLSTAKTEVQFKLDGLSGIIDLIIKDEQGQVYVIDWKTTSTPYTAHQIRTSDQLTMYALAYSKMFGSLPDWVCYVTIDKKNFTYGVFKATRTEKEISAFEQNAQQVIKEREFVTRKNPEACHGKYGKCDFYHHCWPEKQVDIDLETFPPKLESSF